VVRDLEFVQFHPTALMLPGAPHFLISEAVRGEGARLCDTSGASPVAGLAGGDLAPRDQVSRALARRMQELGVENLWLDLRPVGRERLERQFPTILGRCRDLGLEPTAQPIPVAPAAHYWMGGVATGLDAATSIPGLYAVGEVASTGVHGANRLASNSLMECLVYARQLSRLELQSGTAATAAMREHCRPLELNGGDPAALRQAIASLRLLCWQVAGVERQGASLQRARGLIRRQRAVLESQPLLRSCHGLTPGDQFALGRATLAALRLQQELRQRLVLAELLVEAAAFRQESRGGHFRTDGPAAQPFWRRHTLQRRDRPISTGAVGA
ncbi:MAG: FAD-binding protein, partial [Cyanobium sp.]